MSKKSDHSYDDDDRDDEYGDRGNGGRVINGTSGNDSLTGTAGNDYIVAGAGNDRISGGAGNDDIDGGSGNDIIDGGTGNDRIDGGSGDDIITGGAGNDVIDGGSGIDVATFSGRFRDYKLTLSRDGGHEGACDDDTSAMTVHDLRSGAPDGVDVLKNVEILRFSDGEYRGGRFYPSSSGNTPAVIGVPTVAVVTEDVAVDGSGLLKVVGTISITDPDAGQAVFQTVVTPAVGNLGTLTLNSSGSYTYAVANSATQSLGAGQAKVDSFTITSLDGTTKVVNFTINGANDAAVIGTPTVAAVTEDVSVNGSGNLVATGTIAIADADAGQASFKTTVSSAAGNLGTLVLAADGSYTYSVVNSATQSLGAGQTKVDSFTISSVDGTTKVVNFTINGTNDAPVVSGTATVGTLEHGSVVTVDALANASDVDGGTILSVVNLPALLPAGVTYNAATHSFSFDPNVSAYQNLARGVVQNVAVSYGVPDGIATTAATVNFTVTGVNDAPTAVASSNNSVLENSPGAVIGALSTTDPDPGDTFTYTVSDARFEVIGGMLKLKAGQFLDFEASPTVNITVVATDAGGLSKAQAFTINVGDVVESIVVNADSASVREDITTVATGNVISNDQSPNSASIMTVVNAGTYAGTYGTLLLNTDGSYTYTLNNSAANVQSLRQGQLVTETFNHQVHDQFGAVSGVAALQVTVTGTNDIPVIAGAVTGSAVQGGSAVTVDALARASDVDAGTVLTVENVPSSLPAGVSYNAATHSFSIDPTNAAYISLAQGESMPVSVTYSVSDGIFSVPAVVTFTVTGVNDAPVVTGTVTAAVTAGSGLVSAAALGNASDVDHGATLSVVNATAPLPAGVTFSAATQSFTLDSGNAAYTALVRGQTTQVTVNYGVSDGIATTADKVVFTVTGSNHGPSANADVVATNENVPLTFSAATLVANDTDADHDALTVTAVSASANTHGTVVLNSDGTITFTPATNYFGAASFLYTVSDGFGGTSTAAVNVNVAAVNQAPVAVADNVTATGSTPLVINASALTANDVDPEHDVLTVVSVTGDASTHGTVSLNAGQITYTATAGYSGPATFAYAVSDGHGHTVNGTVNVTVANPGNHAPVAVADNIAGQEDTPLVIAASSLLANDTDVDGNALVITAVQAGAGVHGSVVLNGDGTITYTPSANYNGNASFTYTLSDQVGGTATGTVNIAVAAVNDAPVAVADSYSLSEGGTLVTNLVTGVVANDTDVENFPLSAILVSGPAHGTLTLNGNGSFSYTPDDFFNGTDTFTYKANDGSVDSAPATVTLNVAAVAEAPTLIANDVTGNDGSSIALDLSAIQTDGSAGAVTAVTITGLGIGMSLSAGIHNADGSWTVGAAQLSGLSINVPLNNIGDLVLGVTATTIDGLSSASVTSSETVHILPAPPVVFPVTYTVNAGLADTLGAVQNLGNVLILSHDPYGNPLQIVDFTPPDIDQGSGRGGHILQLVGSDTFYGTFGDYTLTTTSDSNGGNLLDHTAAQDQLDAIIALAQGESAVDQFTFLVMSTTGASAESTFTVVYTGVNDAPIAIDSALTVEAGVPIQFLLQSFDPDHGNAFNLQGDKSGLHGTLISAMDGSGVFTFTPDPGYSGHVTFTYAAIDYFGASAADLGHLDIDVLAPVVSGLPSLFGATDDAVDFNSAALLIGNFDKASVFYAGDGDDVVQLPNQVNSAQWGFVSGAMFNAGAGNDTVVGGDGNDTMTGSTGNDQLTGGPGANLFVFKEAGAANVDHVTDFNVSQGDALDIKDLLVSYLPGTSDIANFVRLEESGGNTTVSIDASGDGVAANFVDVAILDGVTGLMLNDLLSQHHLIASLATA